MKENIHKGHRARLRDKVLNHGMEYMAEHEVLEYILSFVIPQKDTNPIAHRLINTFGSLKNVLEADPRNLMQVNGIGEVTALYLNTYMGVYYHYKKSKSDTSITIKTPSDAGIYYSTLLKDIDKEQVYISMLDAKNRVIHTTKLADGSYTDVDVTPRDILDMILKHNAHNILLCHNHPEDKPLPSSSDIRFTRDLILLLTINSMKILDHVIVGKDGYYSFSASNKIASYEKEAKALLNDRKHNTYTKDEPHEYLVYRSDSDDKK